MSNALLFDHGELPHFERIAAPDVAPAVDALLQRAEQALEAVSAPGFPARWEAIEARLGAALEQLDRCWGLVNHLNSVADTPALRAAYNAALPRVTAFSTRLSTDERLYARYQAIAPAALSPAQSQALRNTLRDFVLGGAQLRGAAKERFAEIEDRLAALSQKFGENALDATEAFACYASAEELDGVPADVQQVARAAAQSEGRQGYKLTLKMPCYLPLMQFARCRALREKLYRAHATRASDQAEGEAERAFDNGAVIREILALRREQAQLLGQANFGELSLLPKMAQSPAEVMAFLRDLARRARPHAEKDLAELRAFAAEHLGLPDPQAWDWSYVSEQLKLSRYAFSEQDLKPYFTAPKVLAGLFEIVETLFEVSIRPDSAAVWHPCVTLYRVERAGQLLGQFYLDPAARQGKREGAWMDELRCRWQRPDTGDLQTPVALLVCNFAQSVDGKPPLLSHDDVLTLFHEFGHGLHLLLTQVGERPVSGLGGVEWDAVELPSQFMENFCWQWSIVRRMSAHVDSGEPLPRALFDKMLAARNFQSGLQTVRQIEWALFDMLLHTAHDPAQDFEPLLAQVRSEVGVLTPPPFNRGVHTFSHLFAGAYAAGYYSYKWAEVLSADAYATFEDSTGDDGQPSVETGRRFRQTILETGGSRPAMESFKAFRGRAPGLDAWLRHHGMA